MLGWPAQAAAFARGSGSGNRRARGRRHAGARPARSASAAATPFSVDAPRVDVIDTTGAGDAFVGAFAAALDAGGDRRQALSDRDCGRLARVHDARRAAGAAGARCDRRACYFRLHHAPRRAARLSFSSAGERWCDVSCWRSCFCATAFRAGASDYTDIWFNPSEQSTAGGGWGVNVVQSDAFLFLTFFIYGPDNKPTWYVAGLTRDANGNFNGPLYATTGTYFGAPWNPADGAGSAQVGTASFHADRRVYRQPELCAHRRADRGQGDPAADADVDPARRLV